MGLGWKYVYFCKKSLHSHPQQLHCLSQWHGRKMGSPRRCDGTGPVSVGKLPTGFSCDFSEGHMADRVEKPC